MLRKTRCILYFVFLKTNLSLPSCTDTYRKNNLKPNMYETKT